MRTWLLLNTNLPEKPSDLERHIELQAKLINDEQLLKVIINNI